MEINPVNLGSSVDFNSFYNGRKTVAALFHNRADAENAVYALKDLGIRPDQIGIAMRDRNAQGQLIQEITTDTTEGVLTGAVGGGLLGGIVGFLVGIGALIVPGVGPVISAGVLTTVLGTAGATAAAGIGIGAAAGGLVGALVGMGIPEPEAHYFEMGLREGNTLATVNAGTRSLRVARVINDHSGDLGVGLPVTATSTSR